MTTTTELNVIIDYDENEQAYLVSDAETGDHLFSKASLQSAWDEFKDECERRGATLGDCDYRTFGPDVWDNVQR